MGSVAALHPGGIPVLSTATPDLIIEQKYLPMISKSRICNEAECSATFKNAQSCSTSSKGYMMMEDKISSRANAEREITHSRSTSSRLTRTFHTNPDTFHEFMFSKNLTQIVYVNVLIYCSKIPRNI